MTIDLERGFEAQIVEAVRVGRALHERREFGGESRIAIEHLLAGNLGCRKSDSRLR